MKEENMITNLTEIKRIMKKFCEKLNASNRLPTWNGQIPRKHKLPKLTQEEIENLNRSITNKECISNFQTPTKRSLGLNRVTSKFH